MRPAGLAILIALLAPAALAQAPGPAAPGGPVATPAGFTLARAQVVARQATTIGSPMPGRVVRVELHSAYGYRVIVEHGGLRTAYAHLRKPEVAVGDVLDAGGRLGSVGSTGLSTGCHLHWMAWRNGALVDPLTLLP